MARVRAAGRAAALLAAAASAGCDTFSDWIGWDVADDRPPRASSAADAVARPTLAQNAGAASGPLSALRDAPREPPTVGPAEAFAAEAGDRVFFAPNDARVGRRGLAVLARQARWLHANPNLLATVVGHADTEEALQSRLALALERADRVRQILIAKGVAPDRVAAVAFSNHQPFASPTTAAGRALNRRAVTVITPK